MTCENCIHYGVCPTWDDWNDDLYEEGEYCGGFKKFKNKDDMQKVKHGHWIEKEEKYTTNQGGKGTTPYRECSVCGWDYPIITVGQHFKPYKHCPECGAKMDEKDMKYQ